MLTRREFLSRSGAVLIATPLVAASQGCGSSSTTPATCSGGVMTTSTVESAHAHTICIAAALLSSPPAAGATVETSVVGGHSHTLALSQADLQSIAGGGEVMVTSSDVSAHAHQFTLKKGTSSGNDGGYDPGGNPGY